MAEITTELVAVERMLWTGQATLVTAQTTEGEIGVLPGHQPMLGQLVEDCVVTITPVDGEKMVAAVNGGFISVSSKKITILADSAVWATEVDTAEAQAGSSAEDVAVARRNQGLLKAQQRAEHPI
ncbi:F0F1 ATP synthase subunit epsilon [Corynebacterium choanae]|uniref:ATP synthase epsilon chain n=1 Tax=Corynebacterium choanae TaxID=1862358 RepID=A0A3G6J680_9CORY|nr:F0F1 ATP synthase subunit epsilon [Corynebacterium choanae]AZA13332.1 ATP synthase epsilon chain [Corynebacterium choanae]